MPQRNRWLEFLIELKRRKIYAFAVAYIAFAWVALQVCETLFEILNTPTWAMKIALGVLILLFPLALLLAWVYDFTSHGIERTSASHNNDENHRLMAIMATDAGTLRDLSHHDEHQLICLLNEERQQLRELVQSYGGEMIDDTGLTTVSCFPTPVSAVNCAAALLRYIEQHTAIPLRTAISVGDLIFSEGAALGDELRITQQLAQCAQSNEILVTSNVATALPTNHLYRLQPSGKRQLPGSDKQIACSTVTVTQSDASSAPAAKNFSKPLMAFVGASMIAVVLGLLGYLSLNSARVEASQRSLVVVPFVNRSIESATYLADGVSEQLMLALSVIPELNVTSVTSAFALKDKNWDIKEIAERLQVNHLLEGSVRAEQDLLHISMQLIDSEEGFPIWTESYRIRLNQLPELQQRVAQEVAHHLQLALPESAVSAVSLSQSSSQTYDRYLKANSILQQPATHEALQLAESHYLDTVHLDPSFAPAYAGLCRVSLARFELGKDAAQLTTAEQHCSKAAQMDKHNEQVALAQGQLALETGDYFQATSHYQRAMSNPVSQADGHWGLGRLASLQQKEKRALFHLQKAIELQPGNWRFHNELGRYHLSRGNFVAAQQAFTNAVQLEPAFPQPFNNLGAAYYMMHDYARASSAFEQSLQIKPSRSAFSNLGTVNYFLGNYAKSVSAYRKALETAPRDYRLWGNLADAQYQLPDPKAAQLSYGKAADLAQQVIAANDEDERAKTLLSWYWIRAGNTAQAKALATQMHQAQQLDPEMTMQLALVFNELGNEHITIELLKKALAMGIPPQQLKVTPDLDGFLDRHGRLVHASGG